MKIILVHNYLHFQQRSSRTGNWKLKRESKNPELTPAASDSTKLEKRGSSCEGTMNCGIRGGSTAGVLFWKWVFINSTTPYDDKNEGGENTQNLSCCKVLCRGKLKKIEINLCIRKISNCNQSHILHMVPLTVETLHNLRGNCTDHLFESNW